MTYRRNDKDVVASLSESNDKSAEKESDEEVSKIVGNPQSQSHCSKHESFSKNFTYMLTLIRSSN